VQPEFDRLIRLDADNPPAGGLNIFGWSTEELAGRISALGEPAWRGRQIAEAIYLQRVTELSSIDTLPRLLRGRLAGQGWHVDRPRIANVYQSLDGTERYLIQCPGPKAETVETVWMPEGDSGEAGDESDAETADSRMNPAAPTLRRLHRAKAGSQPASSLEPERPEAHRATICVSSQIGCAVNCQFCLTARLGLQRNLTAGEIAGQVLAVFDRHSIEVGRHRLNLVFMGMGEPFLNYDHFMAAVRLLVNEVGLSPRRMTVSTSGIVPGIERFAQEPPEVRPKLAISLNAPNDRVRAEVMPINRKWPIEAVVDAVRKVRLRPRERLTFEYVLLGGVNDRPEHAREVARLVRRTGLPAKVNLIAWNPGPDVKFATPKPETVEQFQETLIGAGVPAYLRKPRGRDIYAACGQLKLTLES
jgi:23S rRNA (adenine2503-C2)-methyltransferase